jgi:hypothetical protein
MIDRKFQVKQYTRFPLKRPHDDLDIGVAEEKWKHASYKSVALNRKYKYDRTKKFYVWDIPHEDLTLQDVTLTEKARKALR